MLNKELMLEVLKRLNEKPNSVFTAEELADAGTSEAIEDVARYLHDHGLVKADFFLEGLSFARITTKGRDYLAEDGGLTRELGVVTIKLHEDQIHQLIELQIHRSDMPQTQKQRLLDQLRQLPAETTKHLAMQLVDAGLKNWPLALPLLQRFLS
ncbi:hypothetical protein [Stenotrophomonas indicatrix]|uniref:hypothetical protein n=1 Tax=Stenotrophomonas indicatrix TaxID=2045451 RepID=UPI001070AB9F|nr:hypothetical protein [Stenotrophomonas indicatrix]QBR44126.1 hypothetical protein DAIF1_16890 [Stenotrophomonas indicatrix]